MKRREAAVDGKVFGRGWGRRIRSWVVALAGGALMAGTAEAGSEYSLSFATGGGTKSVSMSTGRYQDTYNYSSSGVYSESWISNVEVYDSVEGRWKSLILLDNGQRYAGIQVVPYQVSQVRATCTANTGGVRSFRGKLNGYGDYLTITQAAGSGGTAPTAPSVNIKTYGTNASASSITVTWSGGSGATSYNLYRSTSNSRPSSAYKTGVSSPYTDTDSSLQPGVKYYYWVEAKNSYGSAYSSSDWGNRAVTLTLGSVATVAGGGGSKTFAVTANTGWSATTSASWITLTGASGSGNGTCGFTVAANGSTSTRTGTIVVTAGSGTSYPKSVTNTVTQSGGSSGGGTSGGTGTNKYAVCVGINEYVELTGLSGCVNDSKYMQSSLIAAGWPSANVTRLNDSAATKKAIRKAITNIAAKAVAGDTFVFQQSSHGGQYYADPYNPDEPPLTGTNGKAVYLCVYDEDYYDNTTAYNDYELAADLAKFRTGVKVVVIVDACHSGGLFKSALSAKAAAATFDLAGRVSALMDANRAERKSRGENVAKGLSSSEIGWATAAEYYEYSQDIGFYHTDAWLTDPGYGDEYLSVGYPSSYKVGGTFTASATWGWWNGTADRASYGDRDGYCDAYEFWRYGYDFASNLDSFWGAGWSFYPQCQNTDVLKSVELGPNGSGNGGTGGGTPPTAPTVSIATYGGSANASSITVTWSGGSGATSYNLYRSTSNSRPSSAYKTGVSSPYTDTDSSLQPGVKYYYWVEAKNSYGSAYSSSDWGNRAVTLTLGSVATVAGGGGSKTFAVTANTGWSATTSASWITLTGASGSGNGTCGFTVAANGSTSTRTGTIVVTAGSGTSYPKSVTNTVTQSGNSGTLTLGATNRSFTAAAASSKEVAVTASVSWTAKSSASWLEVKTASGKGNGKIVYNVKANTGSGSRTGKITVTGGGKTATFTVTQSGTGSTTSEILTLGATSRSFTAAAASSKELAVTANVGWTAKSSATSWLVVKTASGSGNGKVVYNVAANTGSSGRSATITVSGGGLTRTFTVTQEGQGGTSGGGGSASLSFTSAGGTKTATFSGVPMGVSTLACSAGWLSATYSLSGNMTSGGSYTATITVTAAANSTVASRSGKVTLTANGQAYVVNVTQTATKAKSAAKGSGGVWVTTSDESAGDAVADGDEGTGWSPAAGGGAWVALSFEAPRAVRGVVVKGEGLPEGMRALVSEDGDVWSEEGSEAASYLWVTLPDEGNVPNVTEIECEP